MYHQEPENFEHSKKMGPYEFAFLPGLMKVQTGV